MQQAFTRKTVQKAKFEAAEMIVDPWNQQNDAGHSLAEEHHKACV